MIYLHAIDPIAFSLGPVKVHWYGLMYLAAFFSAWSLGRSRILRGRLPGVDMDGFSDLLFYGMLGVVLGGRIGYMLFYAFETFVANPLILFKVWEGGMSFHGGLLGVLVACWLWARKHRLHFFDVMDFVAPLVPLGLGFGRLGNFVGGELWGKFTQAGWGVIFPHAPELADQLPAQIQAQYAAGALNQLARHPSQLYELRWKRGDVRSVVDVLDEAACTLCALGSVRAAVRRVPFHRRIRARARCADRLSGFQLADDGQILSLPLIAVGLALLAMSRRAPVLQPVLPTPAGVEAAK